MNRTLPVLIMLSAAALVAFSACLPNREDKPPAPKVTAQTVDSPTNKANDLVAATGGATSGAGATAALPDFGAAPKWELKDLNGNVVDSEKLKGKVVVVDFWATWCGPCLMEIPGYVAMQKKYGKDGLVIVGASVDQGGLGVVKAFAAKQGVDYTLVMADEKAVAAFGGVEAIPTTFLIDRKGHIRDRKVGALESSEYEKRVVAVLNEKA